MSERLIRFPNPQNSPENSAAQGDTFVLGIVLRPICWSALLIKINCKTGPHIQIF